MTNFYIKKLSKRIKIAEEKIIKRYKNEEISEEEDITSQLAGEISNAINGESFNNSIKITAKVFTRKGVHSQESILGADLGVILEKNKKLKKAFLVQSKKGSKSNSYLKITKDDRIKNQCKKMLDLSSDSFVFIYTEEGVYVIPAYAIDNYYLNHKRIASFFEEFFKCFVGDHKLVDLVKSPEEMLKFSRNVLLFSIERAG